MRLTGWNPVDGAMRFPRREEAVGYLRAMANYRPARWDNYAVFERASDGRLVLV